MQIVILCGGLATRLGDIAYDTPKSMISIEGKPFLEYQIENLKNYNIRDIILCVGHLSQKIIDYFGDGKKFGVKIKYSYDGKVPLGPIGALKKAEHLLINEFFIMYGDSYLTIDFQMVYKYFNNYDFPALMMVYKNYDKYDKSNIIIENNLAVGYGEKDRSSNMIYIDYGSSFLKKKILNIVPDNKFFTTGDFFSKLIKERRLLIYEVNERFYHIGYPDALEDFRRYIRKQ